MAAALVVGAADGVGRRLRVGLAVAVCLAGALLTGPRPGETPTTGDLFSVIVRKLPGAGDVPERITEALGGSVGRRLGIIDGFAGEIPGSRLADLRRAPGVWTVTPDARVDLHGDDKYDAGNDRGSIYNLNRAIQSPEMWKKGFTGRSVGIALIDSGVLPVQGLRTPAKVVNGPDLSFESQAENLRYHDTFGHGTHMAGIMAGRDDLVVTGAEDKKEYLAGVAPDARILNMKVADSQGATDVSQVIAAIDWVVHHRNDPGLNIRVLNLSFGTDGIQDYRDDPLSYAVDVAWRKGIVVVVAAGNSGYGTVGLNDPAYNPNVIAVGAVNAMGTPDTQDDTIPSWSSRGDGTRNPDAVAPGQSVTSLRAPGSAIDVAHPDAVRFDRFFVGSGTSQAAAAVSGAAALVLQQRPGATPDQVKGLLVSTASRIPDVERVAQGAGVINMKRLLGASTPTSTQTHEPATGLGSLDLARGSARLSDQGVELRGEIDIFGDPWDARTWSEAAWAEQSWSGGEWRARTWSGDCWCGASWTGQTWAARTWSGESWSARTWSSMEWSDAVWTGQSWYGDTWSARTWSARTWSGDVWSTVRWGE